MERWHNVRPDPITTTGRRLQDRVIFITGATSGIGAAAARRFAAEGAHVVLSGRRMDRLEALVEELEAGGGSAAAVACDVTEERAVRAAIMTTLDTFGRLDGALNNAGAKSLRLPVEQLPTDHFEYVMDVNVRGVFLPMKYEIPAMLQSGGGSIVNMSSMGGLVGVARLSEYSASKWAVIGLTKSVALEHAADGIRVNAIAPGPTRTEMYERDRPTLEDHIQAASGLPMRQLALPDDIARVAVFLLSEESRWTTGAVVPAEGGIVAGVVLAPVTSQTRS